MKVLSFGEILWDIIQGEEHLGGAPFNFAAHIAQCGNSSYIISRVGSDYLGMKAYNQCKSFGVDDRYIQWDEDRPTGIVNVTLQNGQPDYVIVENVAWDGIEWDEKIDAVAAENFDVFYFGSLVQRDEISAATLKRVLGSNSFKHVFFDVNLRKKGYTERIVKESLAYCSIFKLNHEEVPIITSMLVDYNLDNEAFCRCVKALYPNVKTIVITAAEKGCFVFDQDNFSYVPGVAISVTDAVGAGDAFSASFMHEYVKGGDAIRAAAVANKVGAYVATQRGAIPIYSTEIKELLSKDSTMRIGLRR